MAVAEVEQRKSNEMIGAELGSEWRLTPFQRLLLNYAHLDIDGSGHGDNRDFVPRHSGSVTLKRESWTTPESFRFGEADLKPLRGGEVLPWRLQA